MSLKVFIIIDVLNKYKASNGYRARFLRSLPYRRNVQPLYYFWLYPGDHARVQRPFQILGPEYGFDRNQPGQQIDANIRGPLHLTVILVLHFNSLSNGRVIMNISSVQASVQRFKCMDAFLYHKLPLTICQTGSKTKAA